MGSAIDMFWGSGGRKLNSLLRQCLVSVAIIAEIGGNMLNETIVELYPCWIGLCQSGKRVGKCNIRQGGRWDLREPAVWVL